MIIVADHFIQLTLKQFKRKKKKQQKFQCLKKLVKIKITNFLSKTDGSA